MASRLSSYFCPQCGAQRSHPVPGRSGQQVCDSCGTVFTVGSSAPERSAALPPLASLSKPWRNALLALLIVGALVPVTVAWLLPKLGGGDSDRRAAAPAQSKGRADMSALHEAGGKFSRVDVYQRRTDQSEDEHRIEVTDMQSGAALSQPQLYRFPWMQTGGEFRNFSDGQLYLQLKESAVLRLDPGAQQFVDLRPLVMAQFPKELGMGVSKMQFAYSDRPDCFKVVANDGREYYVYWLVGQIEDVKQASAQADLRAARATQTRKYYRYAPLSGGNSLQKRFLLVQHWNKFEKGQPQYLGYFELTSSSEPDKRDRWAREVGSGYTVSAHAVESGLTRLEVIDNTPRFNATVLAENATRLLLSYTATPDSTQGRMLQLMDKQNNQIVWSRDVAQIPLLARERGGIYTRAQGLPSGFFMQGSTLEPGYLMDNQGQLVQEFSWH